MCRLCVGKGGADAAVSKLAALSAGDPCAAGGPRRPPGQTYVRRAPAAPAQARWAKRMRGRPGRRDAGLQQLARICELERLRVHGGWLSTASMQDGCGCLWREEWGLHGSDMQLFVGLAFASFCISQSVNDHQRSVSISS